MKRSLRERYEERKHEEALNEGFMDYFKTGSENIQKFNSTVAQLKSLASKYRLQALQNAVSSAEKQFESIVMAQQSGQKTDTTKSTMISKVMTLVAGMSTFMGSLKNITTQLPSMKDALARAKEPDGNRPLKDLLGADAQKFGQLITTQLQKSGGGVLGALKRFFTGSGTQTPAQVMAEFGLAPETLANELLGLTPAQMNSFVGEGSGVRQFQLAEPTGATQTDTGTKPAEQTIQAAPTQQSQATQQSQPTSPSQQPTQQTGAPQRPSAAQAQERDVAIQRSLRNKNAFNSQVLSGLSNAEIAQDIKSLMQTLGIKL